MNRKRKRFAEDDMSQLPTVIKYIWLFIQSTTQDLMFYLNNGSIMYRIKLDVDPERTVDWLESHEVISLNEETYLRYC